MRGAFCLTFMAKTRLCRAATRDCARLGVCGVASSERRTRLSAKSHRTGRIAGYRRGVRVHPYARIQSSTWRSRTGTIGRSTRGAGDRSPTARECAVEADE